MHREEAQKQLHKGTPEGNKDKTQFDGSWSPGSTLDRVSRPLLETSHWRLPSEGRPRADPWSNCNNHTVTLLSLPVFGKWWSIREKAESKEKPMFWKEWRVLLGPVSTCAVICGPVAAFLPAWSQSAWHKDGQVGEVSATVDILPADSCLRQK